MDVKITLNGKMIQSLTKVKVIFVNCAKLIDDIDIMEDISHE